MRADIDEGFLVDVSARELRDEARNRSHPLASVNSTEPSRREEPCTARDAPDTRR
jgi:hypothetical protein